MLRPVAREQGSTWRVGGQDCVYLSFDAESKLHILSPVRPSGILPETIRVTEERLTGKRYAAGPKAHGFETPEQVRARRRQEQQIEQNKWNIAMGVGSFYGDPPGC